MALLHKAVCDGLQQCHAGLARFLLADRWKTADLLLGHTLAHTIHLQMKARYNVMLVDEANPLFK
jgi:hypothetical protein